MGYFISSILTAFLVPLIIGASASYTKNKKDVPDGKVFPTVPVLILGLVGSVPWIAISIIVIIIKESIWFILFFAAFSFLGIFLLLMYINWRIYFDDEGFTVKNIFGFQRRYSYSDVTAIRETRDGTYIYMGKRHTSVGHFDAGGENFLNAVRTQYKKLHNTSVPIRDISSRDIYKGNVEYGTVQFVGFCVIELLIIVLSAIVILNGLNPKLEDRSQYTEAYLTDYKVLSNKEIHFYGDGGKMYVIDYYMAEHIDGEKISALCNGKSKVSIYSKWEQPEGEPEHYQVYCLSYNGEEILSFDISNKAFSENQITIGLTIGLFLSILWSAFVVLSLIVGRNPDKHPKLFRLLFKSSKNNDS